MLKGNLATRPFYNERLVTLLLALVAVGVAALSYFNVTEFNRLSRERQALRERIDRDEAEAARIRADTARLRQTVDLASLRQLSADATEANTLIDQRTFSWTTFFGTIESLLPFDVRLQYVAPQVERGQIQIKMGVIARTEDDLHRFEMALQKSGIFVDPYSTGRQLTDFNTIAATIQAVYRPNAPRTAPPAGGRGRGDRP
jgi:Tfp pilus assembly protein PilN